MVIVAVLVEPVGNKGNIVKVIYEVMSSFIWTGVGLGICYRYFHIFFFDAEVRKWLNDTCEKVVNKYFALCAVSFQIIHPYFS